MKIILQPMKLLLAVVVGYLSLLPCTTSVMAQSASQSKPLTTTSSRKQPLRLVLPPLPPGQPPGGRRYGGASRGQCPVAKLGLTALVPLIEQPTSVMNVWGQTTAERPTFWFYTPYVKDSAYPVDFVLLDAESNPVYRQEITLPSQPGVMSVSLPASVSPLTTGKQYRWFLNVYCERQKQQSPIYVEGVIQRVNLNQGIVQQLQQAQPRQQVAIYASNGIWYETLTTVAQLRQKNPQDVTLQQEWQDLLSSIGLGDFASKPLISR
ncbi:DUF928 domain-containing protein [Scytonema tolypothrichoides VB-61278]|nr:DUF928 domain-containing protein [Scytonema tolypothrichoides VB-61278]